MDESDQPTAGPSTSAPAETAWLSSSKPRPKKAHLSFNDKEQVDYIRELTAKNVWYYRDRLSVPRGPCNLPVLRECWASGVIDENTLVWGQGLGDWLPVKNVKTLVPQIRTLEVQVTTFIKKHLALRPALNRMHKHRAEQRPAALHTPQVSEMY
ncbi:hypothetical protein WJX73_002409 [Symbiochloris irregularis]|uniref:GYF domain-containing protein n=1 Tax=Symbiochloris irregularis TaxID=706552 RepID=A0AAW1NLC9_9CHLO